MSLIAQQYYEVICCPKCSSGFDGSCAKGGQLECPGCAAMYPVVDGIPVLLTSPEDEVSRLMRTFYESAWKQDKDGVTRAKVQHEDLSDLGQRDIKRNEAAFLPIFECDRDEECTFFLDAGCGAQPRVEFGNSYSYHICCDFSLDGLMQSRKALGNRAICVCGSLLNLPIKRLACDGILASHVLYHIDQKFQAAAIGELYRVLGPGGKLLVLYANPRSAEILVVNMVQKLFRRHPDTRSHGAPYYYHAHPIDHMLEAMSSCEFSKIEVRLLRLFSRAVTAPLYRTRLLGRASFILIGGLQNLLRRFPRCATYVSYIAEK